MTLSLPIAGGVERKRLVRRSWIRRFTWLDAMLASILLGPLAILQVAGRTPSLFWIDLVIGVFSVLSFAKLCARPTDRSFRMPPVILWAIGYVLICTASILLTEDLLLSIATLKLRVLPVAVFLVVSSHARTRDHIDHFFLSITWFGCALAAVSLYNWYRFSSGALALSNEFGPKDMLQASFGRSNYLASMFGLVIPMMIGCVKVQRQRVTYFLCLGATILASVALIFTQSRGALISLAFGLTVWVFLSLSRSLSAGKVLKGFMGLLLIIAVANFAWAKIPEEIRLDLGTAFGLLFSEGSGAKYGSGRGELWAAALKGAWQSNLFGIGLGNQAIWYSRAELTTSAHSLYLETLLETGIVGLVAVLGVLFGFGRILWGLWKISSPRDRPLVGAMLATFVTSIVNVSQEPSFWAPQYSCLFWMMMGVAYSWRRFLRQDRRRGQVKESLHASESP